MDAKNTREALKNLVEGRSCSYLLEILAVRRKHLIDKYQLVTEYKEMTAKNAKECLQELADSLASGTTPSERTINYFQKVNDLIQSDNQNDAKKIKAALRLVDKKGRSLGFDKKLSIYQMVNEANLGKHADEGGAFNVVGKEFNISPDGCKSAFYSVESELKSKEIVDYVVKQEAIGQRLVRLLLATETVDQVGALCAIYGASPRDFLDVLNNIALPMDDST